MEIWDKAVIGKNLEPFRSAWEAQQNLYRTYGVQNEEELMAFILAQGRPGAHVGNRPNNNDFWNSRG